MHLIDAVRAPRDVVPDRHHRPRWISRLAVVIGIVIAAGTAVAAPASAAGTDDYCLTNVNTGSSDGVTCVADLRAAINIATAGRIKDAPLDVADFTDSFVGRVNAAGEAARKNIHPDGTITGPTSYLVAINFPEKDYQGRHWLVYAKPLSNWYIPCVAPMAHGPSRPSGFTVVRSFLTFNGCLPRIHEPFTSVYWEGNANDRYREVDYNFSVGTLFTPHVVYWPGASRAELLEKCNRGTASCTFVPEGEPVEVSLPGQVVGSTNNCTSLVQPREISWAATTSTTFSMSTDISVSASAGVPGFGEFEASVSQSFGWDWTWEKSFTDAPNVHAAPWTRTTLVLSVAGRSVAGRYDLTWPNGTTFKGRNKWEIHNVKFTGPRPNAAGDITVIETPFTEEDIARYCTIPQVAEFRRLHRTA